MSKKANKSDGEDARAGDRDYDVGYGKPPPVTQFKKGQSGNPRGRPRKKKPQAPRFADRPSEQYLEEEAYRLITLRENGEPIELPMVQAVFRSVGVQAASGKRLAQQLFLKLVTEAEDKRAKEAVEYYVQMDVYKRKAELILADCKHRGVSPPELLPHPDDITLNPATGDVVVSGPQTTDEVRSYEFCTELRDHLLLRSIDAEKNGTTHTELFNEKPVCIHMFYATILNWTLPRRYQWEDLEQVLLVMEINDLPPRQRERRIAAEKAHLVATKPKPLSIPPEIRRQFDEKLQNLVKVA